MDISIILIDFFFLSWFILCLFSAIGSGNINPAVGVFGVFVSLSLFNFFD